MGGTVIRDVVPRHRGSRAQDVPVLFAFLVYAGNLGFDTADPRPGVRATLGNDVRESG